MPGRLEISTVAFAAFNLTAALDHKSVEITIEEVYREIENANLITFLNQKLGDFDWSLFGPEFDQGHYFFKAMKYEAEVFKGRERRKLGIIKSGTCLLLAFCIESMQQLGRNKDYYRQA